MGIIRPSIGDYFDERIEAMTNEIARLSRDRVLYDREGQSDTLKAKYTIQEIRAGDPQKDISADARHVTIRIPVENNNEMKQLLKRESHGVGSWLDLDYSNGFLTYLVPAADGEPSRVKERIQNTISHITHTEIDPRNAAIRNGNERVIRVLNELFDQRQAQFKAQDERRSQLEDQLK